MVPVHGKGGWQRITTTVKTTLTRWREKATDLVHSVKAVACLYNDSTILSPERLTVPVVTDHYLYYVPTDHPVRTRRRLHFLHDDRA